MYLKRAKEEDEDMAKRWKDEADKVFLFVSVYIRCRTSHTHERVMLSVDRFVCCRRRVFDHGVNSNYPTKPTEYLQLLSCKHPERIYSPEFKSYLPFSTTILSTDIWHLGQCTLVLELGHQLDMRYSRKFTTAMGTEIPRGDSATFKLQSTQASSDPHFLC